MLIFINKETNMFIRLKNIILLIFLSSCLNLVSMQMPTRIAICVSGTGSNMLAIADAVKNQIITNAEIAVVISNRRAAPALEKAKNHEIKTAYIPNTTENYSQALIDCLQKNNVTPENGLICLAGFMKLLDKEFVTTFKDRILNIHPSLLPAFPGLDAIGQALAAQVTKTGCTVHMVDEGMDTGKPLGQTEIEIAPNDTHETLEAKMHTAEHELYCRVIEEFINSKAQK